MSVKVKKKLTTNKNNSKALQQYFLKKLTIVYNGLRFS